MTEPGQQGEAAEPGRGARADRGAALAAGRAAAEVTLVAGPSRPKRGSRQRSPPVSACSARTMSRRPRRWPVLRERWPGVELHLIGGLQSNKAADAVALFDVIQTLDRPKLAREIAKEMARQGARRVSSSR